MGYLRVLLFYTVFAVAVLPNVYLKFIMKNIFLSIVLYFLLAAVIPLVFFLHASGSSETLYVLLSWLIIFYGSARVTVNLLSERPSILGGMYGVFVYMNFGLATLMQVPFDAFFWPTSYSDSVLIQAYACVGLGCIAFELGFFAARNKKSNSSGLLNSILYRRCSAKRLNLVCIFAVPIVAFLIVLTGVYSSLFVSRSEVSVYSSSLIASSSLYVIADNALRFIPTAVAVLIGSFLTDTLRSRRGREVGAWPSFMYILFFLFYAIVSMLISNPISSPRLWVATCWGAILVVIFNYIGVDSRRYFPVFLLLAYVLVFPFADHFRHSLDSDKAQAFFDKGLINGISDNLRNGDFDGYQQIANTIVITDMNGYGLGYQVLGSLLNFIPRSMWGGKPEGTGVYIAIESGYSFHNLSSPLWAEGFVDFSWPGTFLYLLICGYVFSLLDKGGYGGGGMLCVVVSAVFSCYTIIFLRGAMIFTAPTFWVLGILLFLIYFHQGRLVNRR